MKRADIAAAVAAVIFLTFAGWFATPYGMHETISLLHKVFNHG